MHIHDGVVSLSDTVNPSFAKARAEKPVAVGDDGWDYEDPRRVGCVVAIFSVARALLRALLAGGVLLSGL
jgi:hypothetical protein